MNLEIKKIQLKDLEDFAKSEMFQNFEIVPISKARVKSYIKNPHANPDDFVLYLGFTENKLVAFRSLFADIANTEAKPIRFAWCSGNWVHSGYRRRGFSEQLLKEAYFDWDKKLMFTNYAPASEKLYLKTGWFKPIHQFVGARGYLFPKTRELVAYTNRNGFLRTIFSVVDFIIVIFSAIRCLAFFKRNSPEIKFETHTFPDEQCYKSIDNNNFLFNRGAEELKWIFQNQWISEKKNFDHENYPFSAYSKSFSYKIIKVYFEKEFVGFFIFSVRGGHLKTLFFNLPEEFLKEVAIFIKQYCKNQSIEMVTIYKSDLAAELIRRKFPFLKAKKYGQKIYSSFDVKEINNYRFQDGDGDVIFT